MSKEIELAVQKLVAFITRRGNPYSTSNTVTELYNISTGQIYNQQVAERYTNFSKNSISRYQNFRRDRYIEKSVSLGATITKSNLSSLQEKLKQKTTTISTTNNIRKEMGQAQRSIDIARSRKVLLRNILTYDQIFDGDMTTKPDKSSLMKTLESSLIEDDYKVDKKIKACVIIDFTVFDKKDTFFKTFYVQ